MNAVAGYLKPLPALHRQDVSAAWNAVLERDCTLQEIHLQLGGNRLALTVVGEQLAARLFPALAHRRIAADAPADLQINIWDSAITGIPWPDMGPQGLVEENEIGLRPFFSDEQHAACADRWLGFAALYERSSRTAWAAYADATLIPEFENTSPLRSLFQLLLADRGWHLLHAAMVGRDGRALLLTGPGGSGKSTTACAALLAGWQYGADDLVLFSESGVQVESLYQTVKLRDGGRARLPAEALAGLHRYDESGEAKAYLFVDQHWPSQLLRSARLAAVLVPEIVDAKESTLEPLDWRQALSVALPWTRKSVRTFGRQSQLVLLGQLRRWPLYRLRLGRDPAGVLRALEQALDRHQ